MDIMHELKNEIAAKNLDIDVFEVGCIGMCYLEPIVAIYNPNNPFIFYGNVGKKDALDLISKNIQQNEMSQNNIIGILKDDTNHNIPSLKSLPVMKPQIRLVLQNCGIIDPTNLNHYIANKGYSGVKKALKLNADQILEIVKESGLRGRGGAGFPTWKKWQFCKETQSEQKYLICNADEGDPGAFMNRSLLEGDPHSLLEGMIIASYAIGANKAYIYCRAEYPLALTRLRLAIKQAEENNLLGDNILGSDFSFHIKIKEGAGAFVCGEETALIASIEGKRGMPNPRPPFPAISGLWNKPTIINNVDTLASIARIFQNDAKWFSQYGTENSKGTKSFALVGKVKNTGLIEVPLGTTLREIIFDIGGGIPNEKKFKAVQTGGPSGGCIPENLLDTPVDYESLAKAGSIMGSGGLVVMDEDTCMVDVARYFLDFAQKESCGKCTPCRLGTKQMLTILEDIVSGKGKIEDIDLLESLGKGIIKGSLCGLGQTAPNPVLTTIRYFRNEYEDHIIHKKCSARVCKELLHYHIENDKCTGCHICSKSCPVDAIIGNPKEKHTIDQNICIKCGVCYEKCPTKFSAIDCNPGILKMEV
ncbi:MAG: NADH dehydrogenase [Bacteroidetes bacterium GWF2_33_38]|nr:MAG: NADH dehydrogenase [Bacteroidetes bacterium GWF2_33_38]OFY89690.1 MAG: NADH dehydrogenase [Bacteroidetes bacterium RIFOXYA2_FULL_33_7]